eukprot:1637910-Rhodomonas_salina.2
MAFKFRFADSGSLLLVLARLPPPGGGAVFRWSKINLKRSKPEIRVFKLSFQVQVGDLVGTRIMTVILVQVPERREVEGPSTSQSLLSHTMTRPGAALQVQAPGRSVQIQVDWNLYAQVPVGGDGNSQLQVEIPNLNADECGECLAEHTAARAPCGTNSPFVAVDSAAKIRSESQRAKKASAHETRN